MTNISRRGFLGTSAAAAAMAAGGVAGAREVIPAPVAAAKPEVKKHFPNGLPRCKLGKIGLETTILGMGTGMSNGNPYLDMGEPAFTEMMHYAFDQGVRYIDTAQNYRTHIYVQKALRGWNREEFFILTKTPSRSEETVRNDVGRYIYELGVGHLDVLLLHCMTSGDWPTQLASAWQGAQEAKKAGKVRAVGVSCHSFDAMKKCLEVDDLDVILARINPFGREFHTDETPENVVTLLKDLHDKGVGVLGMKIFGEGKCKLPEQRRESLEFVTALDCVDTMTIGFTETPQVDETLGMLAEIYAKK